MGWHTPGVPAFRTVTVTELISQRPGLSRLRVRGEGRPDDERAYALTDLTGPVAAGDEVVVNTTAVDLDLGTGGWHVVHWNLTRGDWAQPGPGHIMKMRYTSLQADVGAATEHQPDAPDSLDDVPVIACGLHSQLGVIAAVLGHSRPNARLAYVMTDGGALPLALSDLVHDLRRRGLLVGTVTAGHAFGGDHEAVSSASGLALARHALGADVVVAGMGPGMVGTGSRLGFTGLDQATLLDRAAWLGGRPVACVRASDDDARPRHRGMSHHTTTVLDATRSGVDVPVPAGLDHPPLPDRHRIVEITPPEVGAILAAAELRVTTMGRGPAEDPLFFAAAGVAAVHAATLLEGPG